MEAVAVTRQVAVTRREVDFHRLVAPASAEVEAAVSQAETEVAFRVVILQD